MSLTRKNFRPLFHPATLLFAITCTLAGCGQPHHDATTDSFSANIGANTKNVAVLMTAYGSTPGYAGMFEQDLTNFQNVIADPKGNYQFETRAYHQVSHRSMEADIRDAAARVTTDGTLLVFITAHGAPNGYIQPADQAYATFGYQNILNSIRQGRQGKGPIQRLVVVISACYSGSWLQTLASSDDAIKQRLVMTSVDANNLSMIGSATSAVYRAFQAMKDKPQSSMAQFLSTAKSYSGGWLQYSVNDTSILNEAFIQK